jgi:hypothetical protein
VPDGVPFLISPALDFDIDLNRYFLRPAMIGAAQNTQLEAGASSCSASGAPCIGRVSRASAYAVVARHGGSGCAREYLIDASAYWRINGGAVLAAAWRDHLERGLVWICPQAEIEICRRVSKDQHAVHLHLPRSRLPPQTATPHPPPRLTDPAAHPKLAQQPPGWSLGCGNTLVPCSWQMTYERSTAGRSIDLR